MLKVDNRDKLKDIIEFKDGTYYKFVCLLRTKDYKKSNEEPMLKCMEKQEILVKDWLIDNQEMLDKTLPDMITFTEVFKCRLYMCTDRKSIVKTLKTMRDTVQNYLDPFIDNPNTDCSIRAIKKICSSATNKSESSDREGRRWLFDVDSKDIDVNILNDLNKVLEDKLLAKLETKNGYHYITKKDFDANKLLNGLRYLYNRKGIDFPVELKDNAMTLIAMG